MCEFCHQHGEGKKWYLQAKNYSDDLLSDAHRRKFIEEFFSHPEGLGNMVQALDRLAKAPSFVKSVGSRMITRKMKKKHFGQVVPIEEIEEIFGFVNSIARLECICRHTTLGKKKRYCYGISMMMNDIVHGLDKSYLTGPDTIGLEELTKEEAIAAFHEHEKEGLCHTVWAFYTPFIGGICNCDRKDCLAMRSTVTEGISVMFRGEYVAEVNPDECSGCRQCMRMCQFGAITYSASDKKVSIDKRWCYGCGVCRSICPKDAISLADRSMVPVAAALW